MGIRSAMYGWFRDAWRRKNNVGMAIPLGHYDEDDNPGKNDVRMNIQRAANGRLLTVKQYKPVSGPGADWETTLYLVPDGESLINAVAQALARARITE